MRRIDERSEVATVAQRWANQYEYHEDSYRLSDGTDPKEIQRQLEALGPQATCDDVAKIIGNTCWTGPYECAECGRVLRVLAAVQHYSTEIAVCHECLLRAAALCATESPVSENEHQ